MKRAGRQRAARSAPAANVLQPNARASAPQTSRTLLAFVVVFLALGVSSSRRMSATWDEPGHIAAGYAALARGDYRLDIEHPPVARMWSALPLLAMRPVLNVERFVAGPTEAIAFRGPFDLGHAFLFADNDAGRLLQAARMMNLIVGAGLGVLVFVWLHAWLGYRAAVSGLVLYTLEPNMAAHAGLATTDIAVTACLFATTYFAWRRSRERTRVNLAALAVFYAAAVLSKFSAVIHAPALVVLLLIASRRDGRISVSRAASDLAAIVLVTFAAAWAAYGFRFEPSAHPGWVFTLDRHPALQQAVPLWAAVAGRVNALHLLPNALTEGFLHGQALALGRPAFFAGEFSTTGWWYFFPSAMLLKTPMAVLLLLAIGLVALFVRRKTARTEATAVFLVLPPAAFLLVAMTSHLNIGLRHVLPVYPFAVVLAAAGVDALLRKSRAAAAFAVSLLAVGLVETGFSYPDRLGFFNVLAGGPRNGFRYLADSNVDWGQGLPDLRVWMERQAVDRISLAYFGTADPKYYGIRGRYMWGTTVPGVPPGELGPPELPGFVAVSVTLLDGVPFDAATRDFYKSLRDREPAATIGSSIRVYRVDAPWW